MRTKLFLERHNRLVPLSPFRQSLLDFKTIFDKLSSSSAEGRGLGDTNACDVPKEERPGLLIGFGVVVSVAVGSVCAYTLPADATVSVDAGCSGLCFEFVVLAAACADF